MAKLLTGTRIYGNASIDTALTVGSNLTINTSAIAVGNSTVNTTITSNSFSTNGTLTTTGLITGGAGLTITGTANASTGVNVGANVNLSTSQVAVGNSTVNTTITSSSISTNGTLTTTGLITGSGGATITGTANASTGVNVGANVNLSTSQVAVGNSTVNTVVTQTTASFNANSSATALYVAANGNIGIGNSSPAQKLDVVGSIKSSALTSGRVIYAGTSGLLQDSANLTFDGTALTSLNNSTAQSIILSRTSATARNWGLGVDADGAFRLTDSTSGNVILSAGAAGITTLTAITDLVFKASNTEQMRITSAGNLGIGTTSAQYLLEVKTNNTAGQGIKIWGYSADGSKNSNIFFGDNAGTNSYVLRFVNTYGGGTGELYGLNLRSLNTSADFNVMAGTEASSIAGLTLKGNSGNVGIGTTSPSEKLDIQSSADLKARIYTTGSLTHAGLTLKTATYEYIIQNLTTTAGSFGALRFYDITADVERMRITSTGNVGIGCVPTNKLEISGGSIRTINNTSGRITFNNDATEAWLGFNGAGLTTLYSGALPLSIATEGANYITISPNTTEAMRFTSAGNVGIGTTSPYNKLAINGSDPVLYLVNSKTAANGNIARLTLNPAGGFDNATYYKLGPSIDGYLENSSTNLTALVFSTYNGSSLLERMRIDSSGNVGIGTASPAASTLTLTGKNLYFSGANFVMWDTGGQYGINSDSSTRLSFYSGSATERMRINSSGFVGIGQTTPISFLDIYGSGAYTYSRYWRSDQAGYGARFGTADTLMGSAPARSAGVDGFSAVVFGIAGTESMRLNSSGNLGIGTSSPGSTLTVAGTISSTGAISGTRFNVNASTAIDAASVFGYNSTQGTYIFSNVGSGRIFSLYNGTGGEQYIIGTSFEHIWLTNTAEQMRLTTTGLGIGSSPSFRLQVAGASDVTLRIVAKFAQNQTTDNSHTVIGLGVENGAWAKGGFGWIRNGSGYDTGTLTWYNRNTIDTTSLTTSDEVMRINQDGVLGVGSTIPNTNSYYHRVSRNAPSRFVFGIENTNTGSYPNGLSIVYSGTNANGSTDNYLVASNTTETRFAVKNNGGIANYQANDANLSDRREKTDIEPAKSYLNIMCQIPVVTFNYIDQSVEDPGKTLGVIAQDVEAVAPEFVTESNWGSPGNESKIRKSIYQTDFQFALLKCIQEQQALITQLQADVALLKQQIS